MPKGFNISSNVTSIGFMAFYDATIESGFKIEEKTLAIVIAAFKKVLLTKGELIVWNKSSTEKILLVGTTNIPKGVTSIAAYAFQEVNFRYGLVIPSSATSIDKLTFNDSVIYDGQSIVWNKSSTEHILLRRITNISSNITPIRKWAFSYATLPAGFTLPPNITSIGSYAFYKATLLAGFTLPQVSYSLETMLLRM